ncbi:hypothetical protein AB0883_20960 [Micromonospora sp. NPDC047812]|uniref:hypothetical protein n=1 Tax=Micromonospora sp. NPDC047812 TaxID=3155742 RepID=UPI0034573B2D
MLPIVADDLSSGTCSDEIRVEAAASAGTEVPDGTVVTGLTTDGERVAGVRYITGGGRGDRAGRPHGRCRWIALNPGETRGHALYAERPRLTCTYYIHGADAPIDHQPERFTTEPSTPSPTGTRTTGITDIATATRHKPATTPARWHHSASLHDFAKV